MANTAMTDRLARPTGSRQTMAATFLLVGMIVTVGGALLFEHVGGYIPCALCLKERIPYYVGIPIAFCAAVAAAGRAPALLTRTLILLIGLIMLYSLYLAVYHAGVEWHFWAGPTDCASVGGADLSTGNLLDEIDRIHPPSCDAAAGRFLGLSFAGWNAVASAIFAAVALRSAIARPGRMG
ncbi:disulfide bond formation protein B [Aurantimonas sp. VKM B-3413]|uniref:disulfide bond formation protein B n=1 Tax=Aurantimonas sp. VKM B-3413 TaxID=2779401 RepID=UPI001E62F781|nr:disulfide bond formation protein B [Aurantimonas sp. VKM B-3413]MCB8837385.1 disulfide bond formation protein B [Aurantimonas sp. VKM B-3413]